MRHTLAAGIGFTGILLGYAVNAYSGGAGRQHVYVARLSTTPGTVLTAR